ncbi:hypothetical protein Patl1_18034 [Pistacia atlantica]|uniref:Uncharacterized protein n=1 Tax=Pistacia atlantica TaxID=434234 RepID=A0ACC1C3D5_9ROSI|nr:hypothetical protein Patl1_18034 [Pistacia atlantica]
MSKMKMKMKMKKEEEEEEEEEEFEFALVCRRPDSPISADEIFCNGQIRPIYPVFDTSLLLNDTDINQNTENNNSSSTRSSSSSKSSHRLPLGKLMSEERESTTSCSSSEAEDLDNLQPGTYCVWAPKANSRHQDSPGRSCKKSNSTGSSKRWKFRDFLYRSNSDGKDTFVFLAPNKKTTDKKVAAEESGKENKGKVKVVEEHYVKNHQAIKEEDKKKSFLPYRQDLVGFFNNVNGLSRNLHPF